MSSQATRVISRSWHYDLRCRTHYRFEASFLRVVHYKCRTSTHSYLSRACARLMVSVCPYGLKNTDIICKQSLSTVHGFHNSMTSNQYPRSASPWTQASRLRVCWAGRVTNTPGKHSMTQYVAVAAGCSLSFFLKARL